MSEHLCFSLLMRPWVGEMLAGTTLRNKGGEDEQKMGQMGVTKIL